MALSFTEDLDAFFDTPGFTVPVVFGDTTGVGYFESPNEIIADGVVLTTDYAVGGQNIRFFICHEWQRNDC